ncbi:MULTISPECIES: phosphoribosyl-AMP cyclohydrolase [Spiribacter]|uniref:phosphoribosyl-AMP cyclohydrolase n=1 Tax=Spiribacter TaxID=1335745 RepID=UPI000D9F11DD|nr:MULTISPECIES: phosphoribosyl-AMP cyclohydrolase [Spiribacter]KAF0283896.1 phosphoribosyl-AMP cyclohydrolase [Spiribacter roseus]KAF0285709.1 phosphoribosyl-AMP cyclohydrolase [Spiribacter sp. SSL99]PZA00832.1 phosphoribosyl-AMP cyclohydrolase [Gammaproteobacteria bacterium 2W06]
MDGLDAIAWNADGLVPVIAQDADDGRVLMMAWMSPQTLETTRRTGEAVYWSRSRQRPWHKGESSGNVQRVRAIELDCDGDTLLLQVEQRGGVACHTGRRSCFYRRLAADGWRITDTVRRDPADMYGEGSDE